MLNFTSIYQLYILIKSKLINQTTIVMKHFYLLLIMLGNICYGLAQTGISTITRNSVDAEVGRSYASTGAGNSSYNDYGANRNFNYRFGTNSGQTPGFSQVASFVAGGITYNSKVLPVVVKMRRVDNANVIGIKDVVFFKGVKSGSTPNFTLSLNSEYNADMESVFASNNIFNGTDNIFHNGSESNRNNNNIERVDVMVPSGMSTGVSSKSGFPIFERGNAGQHDPFKVALILGVDASGNPNAYSNIISVSSGAYASSNPIGNTTFYVLRRTGSDDLLVSADATQGIGGVFFKFSDFGVSNGTTIYGYSLLSSDFAGTTPASVVNYNNNTNYPTTTTDAGGIDLMAALLFVDAGSISGRVFNDADGMSNNMVDGDGTNAGGLYAVLYNNTTHKVVGIVEIPADGTFTFEAPYGANYSVYTTSTPATLGQTEVPVVTLPSGWQRTGEIFGSGEGDDGNANGILDLGVVNVPVSNVKFGLQQSPMAVMFGAINASIKDNQLLVNWETLHEENVNYFDVQVSSNGTDFTSVQKVKSLATDGNSDSKISYSTSIIITAGAVMGSAVLGLLFIGLTNRRRWLVAVISIFMISGVFIACQKSNDGAYKNGDKLFVRIVQIDKDGGKQASKVVQATRN